MKNLLLCIKYDGSNYHGWARQPGIRTVCGRLEEEFGSYLGTEITLEGASRTDAGVHANAQCATLIGDINIPTEKIPHVLNMVLAEDRLQGLSDAEIVWAKEMPEGFHARFSSKGKRYIYKIRNCKNADIFLKNYRWQIKDPLDIKAMNDAAQHIIGEHDFACFQSSGSPKESTIREVYSLKIERCEANPEEIILSIEGNGFLYNMVRIITGTLVEVGLGKRAPEDLIKIIESKDRSNAGVVAPAGGLWLDEVFY